MRAEEVDGRHEHKPGEDSTGEHNGSDTHADDVADTKVLRRDIGADGGSFEEMLVAKVGGIVGCGGEEAEEVVVLEESVDAAETKSEEDAGCEGTSALAGHENVRRQAVPSG